MVICPLCKENGWNGAPEIGSRITGFFVVGFAGLSGLAFVCEFADLYQFVIIAFAKYCVTLCGVVGVIHG
jgi:hypothetical protein